MTPIVDIKMHFIVPKPASCLLRFALTSGSSPSSSSSTATSTAASASPISLNVVAGHVPQGSLVPLTDDASSSSATDIAAHLTLPVIGLRPGIRSVPLNNPYGERIHLAALLIVLELRESASTRYQSLLSSGMQSTPTPAMAATGAPQIRQASASLGTLARGTANSALLPVSGVAPIAAVGDAHSVTSSSSLQGSFVSAGSNSSLNTPSTASTAVSIVGLPHSTIASNSSRFLTTVLTNSLGLLPIQLTANPAAVRQASLYRAKLASGLQSARSVADVIARDPTIAASFDASTSGSLGGRIQEASEETTAARTAHREEVEGRLTSKKERAKMKMNSRIV
ncbi:unnamed protein product [Protopolystoma xenopodis]|uniref:Uncharacterized protein n=1 Tax=Protopolystoma xenopodis TaxID=117903 RepID=A0A448WSX6_9PLAT|nr:unnamed protein product [Protopolystoma xenopodis]